MNDQETIKARRAHYQRLMREGRHNEAQTFMQNCIEADFDRAEGFLEKQARLQQQADPPEVPHWGRDEKFTRWLDQENLGTDEHPLDDDTLDLMYKAYRQGRMDAFSTPRVMDR